MRQGAARLFAGRDLASEAQLAVKMTLAAALSWWLATLAGEPRPIFAALVGLVALTGGPFQSLYVAVGRVVGVVAGVLIGLAVLQLDLRLLWLVALGLLLGALAGIPLRVGDRPNIQAAVSALFLIGVSSTGAFHAGVARLWETALGAGVTLIVAVTIWPPHPLREVERRRDGLRDALLTDLARVAEALDGGAALDANAMDTMRAHSLDAVRLEQARRALRLNPLRGGDLAAFARVEEEIHLAARVYRHTRSLARDVLDTGVVARDLASVVRAIGDAVDRALRGEPFGESAADAAGRLGARAREGVELVVATQLGQLIADVQERRIVTEL
jgi:uncharacterized membrane protein YgaE (UPF0421/DUF939 family)